ncbi:MAG: DUF308 domain-containing protein [Pseudoxanthomonas sp.]
MHTIDINLQQQWLKRYYALRAAFSLAWVAAAFGLGLHDTLIAAVLLVLYPAWDAIANYVDARRSGGLARNKPQAINVALSVITTAAVLVAVRGGLSAVLGVYGVWAIGSGVLQLRAAIDRRKQFGGQWAMILSGAQSALAGAFFLHLSRTAGTASIANLAGYAGMGAVYFLVSAVWLALRDRRAASIGRR